MIRAGVPEKIAMEVSGHKTAAMLRRYNITDTRDIIEAGQRTASSTAKTNGGSVKTNGKVAD